MLRRAFRVAEARIDGKACRLALARDLHRLLGLQGPGMIEIQVRNVARHGLGVRQAGAFIARGVARDRAGLGHGQLDRRGAQIGGAGRALAVPEVHGHGHAAVAMVLDGVDLAQAHRHGQSLLHAGVGVGRGGTGSLRQRQRAADHLLQFWNTRRVDFLGHGRIVAARERAPRRIGTMSDAEDVDDEGDFAERPSRTARKRAAEHAQRLGVRLSGLRDEQLLALALPAELLEALHEARRLRGHSALARQYQYIGRLMRGLDPAPIERALELAAGAGGTRVKIRR